MDALFTWRLTYPKTAPGTIHFFGDRLFTFLKVSSLEYVTEILVRCGRIPPTSSRSQETFRRSVNRVGRVQIRPHTCSTSALGGKA